MKCMVVVFEPQPLRVLVLTMAKTHNKGFLTVSQSQECLMEG